MRIKIRMRQMRRIHQFRRIRLIRRIRRVCRIRWIRRIRRIRKIRVRIRWIRVLKIAGKKYIKKGCSRKKFWKDGSKFDERLLKTQKNKCLLHLRKVIRK